MDQVQNLLFGLYGYNPKAVKLESWGNIVTFSSKAVANLCLKFPVWSSSF